MPIDSESQTAISLTIRNFSLKNLYLRAFLYSLIAYVFIDLMVGVNCFLSGHDHQLLFSPASFLAIFNIYPNDILSYDNEPLYVFLVGILFVALFFVGYSAIKLLDTLALIFHPLKRKEKNYPCRVVVTNSRINLHFNDQGTEKMETLLWKQDFFAVFLKMKSDYQLRLCLVQDPNYHITDTDFDEEDEEYNRFSRMKIRQVKLGRMFLSGRDRIRACGFLINIFFKITRNNTSKKLAILTYNATFFLGSDSIRYNCFNQPIRKIIAI